MKYRLIRDIPIDMIQPFWIYDHAKEGWVAQLLYDDDLNYFGLRFNDKKNTDNISVLFDLQSYSFDVASEKIKEIESELGLKDKSYETLINVEDILINKFDVDNASLG